MALLRRLSRCRIWQPGRPQDRVRNDSLLKLLATVVARIDVSKHSCSLMRKFGRGWVRPPTAECSARAALPEVRLFNIPMPPSRWSRPTRECWSRVAAQLPQAGPAAHVSTLVVERVDVFRQTVEHARVSQ